MSTPAAITMEGVIGSVTSVFTAAIGWVGTVAQTISDEPLLLIYCVIPLVGLGVGLFSRLLRA